MHIIPTQAAAVSTSIAALLLAAGRPCSPTTPPAPPDISNEVLDFVYCHPGCVSASEARRRYSDEFRLFVLDLVERRLEIDLAAIAHAIRVPLGTLHDWLKGGAKEVQTANRSTPAPPDPRQPQIETVLSQWKGWNGTFVDFCSHLQLHHRLPFGCTMGCPSAAP